MSKNHSFTKKAKITIFLAFSLFVSLIIEVVYLQNVKSMDKNMLVKKQIFVGLTALPDLAFANENSYVRHRSLAKVFDIYNNDSSLREYSDTTFAINHKEIN
jgi:hypothetical protein